MIRIRTFTGGGFAENCYLLADERGGPAMVIDPGAAATRLVETLRAEGIEVSAVLLTHAHLDHIEGVRTVKDYAPDALLYLHPGDRPLYEAAELQAQAFDLPSLGPLLPPERELAHGDRIPLGRTELEVRHVPGHSPGHVLFFEPLKGAAFVGDVIFLGAIGRTDLPGGDYQALMTSIRTQILTLPSETRLYPGHGDATTVGWERRTNPFLVGHYGGEFA